MEEKPLLSESEDFWKRLDAAAAVADAKESAPVSKEEYRRQLGEFTKPEVVELFAPLCAADVAERNFKQCVKEIDQAIEESLEKYEALWHITKYVDSVHAARLRPIYEDRGFVVDVQGDKKAVQFYLRLPKMEFLHGLTYEQIQAIRDHFCEEDEEK